jgi:hypothetical protein
LIYLCIFRMRSVLMVYNWGQQFCRISVRTFTLLYWNFFLLMDWELKFWSEREVGTEHDWFFMEINMGFSHRFRLMKESCKVVTNNIKSLCVSLLVSRRIAMLFLQVYQLMGIARNRTSLWCSFCSYVASNDPEIWQ